MQSSLKPLSNGAPKLNVLHDRRAAAACTSYSSTALSSCSGDVDADVDVAHTVS